MNASPHPYVVEQPDGTRIRLRLRGNPRFRWQEDMDGFTVLRRHGRYFYARRGASGRLDATEHEVGKANPRAHGFRRHEKPSAAVRAALRASGPEAGGSAPAAAPQQVSLTQGTLKNLVVLIRFADHTNRNLPSVPQFDSLFNATSFEPDAPAPAGSLRMVYEQNSYGQLTIDSTVYAWVTVSGSEDYYANGTAGLTTRTHEALREALNKVDEGIDFSQFDNNGDGYIDSITFLHSGYGAEWGGNDTYGTNYLDRIWSHKWSLSASGAPWTSAEGVKVNPYHISPSLWGTSGSNIGRVGVIAHETGHFLGLPDLYDTDNGAGEGIGSWGLMANAWGFDGNQRCIPHMSAWSKIQLGWSNPTVLTGSGDYSLGEVENNNEIYRIDHNYYPGEYLLIENRQPAGTEECMPQGGIIVYHIDDSAGYNTQGYPGQSGWPGNGNHYRVALLQADGDYDLEKGNNRGDDRDAYHADDNDVLDGSTVPNTNTYQGGNIFTSDNRIYAISQAGPSMSFSYDNGIIPPTAAFNFVIDNLTAYFSDASTDSDGTIAAWLWDFGDGNSSSAQNPSHAFAAAGTYLVNLTVIDDESNTDNITRNVTVSVANLAPVLAVIGNRTVDEGDTLSFTATATDPDVPATLLTYSLDAGAPTGATIDPASGAFSWTPTESQGPGSYTVTVRVTDSGTPAQDDFETLTITVNEVNQAPVLTAIGDKTVDEGTPLTFTAAATDPDSPANTLTYSLDAGAPASATLSPSGAFTWTPTEDQGPGSYALTVRVTDSGTPAREDFETLTVTVKEVNQAPVLAAIGNKAVNEQAELTFTASATDADDPSNNLTFSLDAGAPAGATINPTTGVFSWTPSEAQGLGSFPITVRVTDNGTPARDDFETITVTVNPVNLHAPVLASIGDQTVPEGASLTFTATANDLDEPANTLTFTLDPGAPTGAAIDQATGAFSWTPTETQGPGSYLITVRVTDDRTPVKDDAETFTVTVNEVNQAPVLAALGDRTVDEGATLAFTAAATDVDNPTNALTYSLDAGAPEGATINPTTGAFSWTPAEAQGPGSYLITVRVVDDGTPSASDFRTFTATVNEVNQPPVLAAIGDRAVNEGTTLSFTASATDPDAPANSLTYSLGAGAPPGAAITPSGVFTWTPTEAQGPGAYAVLVQVTDNGTPAHSDIEIITVTVNEVNEPPVLASIVDRTIDEGTQLSFTATATDPDAPANTLTYSLDAGAPAGAAIDPVTGIFTWTPTEAQGPGSYAMTIRVTDSGTPQGSDAATFTVTVNEVNLLPVAVDDSAITSSPATGNVLLNDDQGDAPATVTGHTAPANGSVTIDAAGNFVYTPNPGFSGTDSFTYTITDTDGDASTATVTITVNPVSIEPVIVFADSFEEGLGNWAHDENHWFSNDRRATDGYLSAEVEGYSSDATLISPPIDVTGQPQATITFSWFIESGLDLGEYLAFDVSLDGGVTWQEKATLKGDIDPEDTMHDMSVTVDLGGASTLTLRFRGTMSKGSEDANLDNVIVTVGGTGEPPPPLPSVPTAEFSYVAAADMQVTFTDASTESTKPITAWSWDFGDGNISSEQHPVHAYGAAGSYDVALTVFDSDGGSDTVVHTVVVTDPNAEVTVFADSFEEGLGNWAHDENHWFSNDRRATDGYLSAEVEGYSSDATLISPPIDVAGRLQATVTFSWFIESGLDLGEYLAFDVSLDGGVTWQEKATLKGDIDPEETMHDVSVTVDLGGASTLTLRFRGTMSKGSEDANLDNVIVNAR